MTQVSPRSSLIPPIRNRKHNESDHVTEDSSDRFVLEVREEPVKITWNSEESLDNLTYHHPAYNSGNHVTGCQDHVIRDADRLSKRNNVLSDELSLINKQSPASLQRFNVLQPIPTSNHQISLETRSPERAGGSLLSDHYSTPLSYEGSDWGAVPPAGGKRRRVDSALMDGCVVLSYNNREKDNQILRLVQL